MNATRVPLMQLSERPAGWRGSRYVRPRDARRAGMPPEDGGEVEDTLDDIGRR